MSTACELLEFTQNRLDIWDRNKVVVYEPNPRDEENFINRFSTPPHKLGFTIPAYFEDLGSYNVSTLALYWMAIYRKNRRKPNFKDRFCHDFVKTFLGQDIMETEDRFASGGHYFPIKPIVSGEVHSEASHPLNTALVLGITSIRLIRSNGDQGMLYNHSVIAVTPPNEDKPQLFMSKFNRDNAFIHTLPVAADFYNSTHYALVQDSDYVFECS